MMSSTQMLGRSAIASAAGIPLSKYLTFHPSRER